MTKTLKQQFESIVDKYVNRFCFKHELDPDNGYWIADDKSGIYENADCYFSLQDILYDIDNNLPTDMIFDWYYATLDYYYINPDANINLRSWHRGLRYTDLPKPKESVLKRIKGAFKRIF